MVKMWVIFHVLVPHPGPRPTNQWPSAHLCFTHPLQFVATEIFFFLNLATLPLPKVTDTKTVFNKQWWGLP